MKILKILKETICSDNKNTLSIGNAIFTKVKPTEEITGLASKYYNALISKLESKEQVDNYISEKTKGKIKEIVDSISNIDMLLINTVYFYSEWKYQFDPKNTFKGSFNLSNKSKKDVMFMYEKYLKKTDVLYFENEDAQGVSLPYMMKDVSSIIILPKKKI